MLLALLAEELLFRVLSAFREDGGFPAFSFPFDDDGSGGMRDGMLNDDISKVCATDSFQSDCAIAVDVNESF